MLEGDLFSLFHWDNFNILLALSTNLFLGYFWYYIIARVYHVKCVPAHM